MFIPQGPVCRVFAYGEFYWSEAHKCHVWGGVTRKPRELTMDEFNKVADKLLHEQEFFGQRTVRMLPDPKPIVPPPVFAPVVREGPTLAQLHDELVERSVGAMAIAEGDEDWQKIPIDCPMLEAVAKLRRNYEAELMKPAIPSVSIPSRKVRRRSRKAKV